MRKQPQKRSVYAQKLRIMLRILSAPDGTEWGGTKMERATEGKVSASYFSALRDGYVEVPRADKVEAIAKAMGFPPGLWFKSLEWWEEARERWRKGGGLGAVLEGERREADPERLSRLLNRLFQTSVDEETGEPLTNAKVAEGSGGVLSEEDVEAMREGRLVDPTWAQILALSDAFGVEPSYWSEREAPSWRPPPAVLEAVEGLESYQIFQNSLRLSGRDRGMLKMLAEHLRREQEEEEETGRRS